MRTPHGLTVDDGFARFVESELLPGTSVHPDQFWGVLASLLDACTGRNRELLLERERLAVAVDERLRAGLPASPGALRSMGYLVPEGPAFRITTAGVDPEIADVAGPQLVVPVMNARYALNAANARWGSLCDAVYGTDVLGPPPVGPYDPARGARVMAWIRAFLDDVLPLEHGSHADIDEYVVRDGRLVARRSDGEVGLSVPGAFVGHRGDASSPSAVVLRRHGLHLELCIDRSSPVGAADRAGWSDVLLEAALTAIMDFEDSVAAVDADDKVVVYRNWLGLMRGDLAAPVDKGGVEFERRLAADREVVGSDGVERRLRGRAVMLARNVGLHMTTDTVCDVDGQPVFEGLLDLLVTVTAALHDRERPPAARNSRSGSVYIVKPKLHGPAEVAFAVDTFAMVEDLLELPRCTVKIGIMDEERRTSVNLLECIRAASDRVVFVNTGFLDRTGDEIHTSMWAGPMVRKADMKRQQWIDAYERRNVDIALSCGFKGVAQIGKGMWAAPDRMADMVAQKIAHLEAGASCAWVPSPTAATLHATHYHRFDVAARQTALQGRESPSVDDLLAVPLGNPGEWTADDRQHEIDNNVQSILGYVVRWVDQGIGCSKVPDLDDVALMEDRATCRISSQLLANWLLHRVVTIEQIDASLARMAQVVDHQNAADPLYRPMAPAFDGPAFRAARSLIVDGRTQPAGYTEAILHAHRLEAKASSSSRSTT